MIELARVVGDDVVTTDPDIVAAYAHDQSRLTERGTPVAVLAPRTTAQVAACMTAAHRLGVTVIARGAGSGLSGAANAVDGSVILSLHRMNRIVSLAPANRVAVVQPGVVTGDLRAAAAAARLFYPPDPGSMDFSTVGGNIATNAGGMCCVKYGVTGDFVLALEVVLADGRIVRTGRRTIKGVAGYDLTRLFVGSEGTLGIITEATMRLVSPPHPAHTLVASFPQLAGAGRAVSGIVGAGLTPSMLEILDHTTVRAVDALARMGLGNDVHALLLIQSDGPDAAQSITRIEQLCLDHGASETAISDSADEGALLLEARRLALPALERLGNWLLDDVCVPLTKVTTLIESIELIAARHSLTIGVFGHAGDGNLHPTIIYDEHDATSRDSAFAAFNDITRCALDLGGTVTGEHGVGRLKKQWLAAELGATALDVHLSVKRALDPRNVLNPSAVFDTARIPATESS
ncbi:FAD-binding oxidoreductase [Rhodococcus sp. NPDC057014]|uniref:FAD-binding oxidoreductase n=1 Tax=Rhodococcus sp. NPDC057014 TaxID=3346000 RepID=UPI0036351408